MEKQLQNDLVICLKELCLPTIRKTYAEQADLARQESLSYEHYLLELAQQERAVRRNNRIARYLRDARLPLEKSLQTFDRKRLPRKIDMQLSHLLAGDFLDRRENILAFGNPGSGKTHLLCAIAQELVYKERRVKFLPCSLLVQELLIAKRDLKLPRLLKQFAKYDALLIDDIGYVQQSREEMEVLFTLLADRYERGSVMLTSNLPFSHWEKIFKDPMTTAAAIDRVVHHSIILELNLPSYRLEQAQNKKNHPKKEAANEQNTTLKNGEV
jgi:DNA replication protein DnaC